MFYKGTFLRWRAANFSWQSSRLNSRPIHFQIFHNGKTLNKNSPATPRTPLPLPSEPSTLWNRFKRTKLYQILHKIEWKRWIFGDFSIPYNADRIIKLKFRDGVPLTADMIYSFRMEGMLRSVAFTTSLFTFPMLGFFIYWLLYGFQVKPESKRTGNVVPRFETSHQNEIAGLFGVALWLALHVARRRAIVRVYYDRETDLFQFIRLTTWGRLERVVVKSGDGIVLRNYGFKEIFFGNHKIRSTSGKSYSIFTPSSSYVVPWYYNQLIGIPNVIPGKTAQNPMTAELDVSLKGKTKEELAFEIAKINATKMEQLRLDDKDEWKMK